MTDFKVKLVSLLQTFLANLLSIVGIAILALPDGTLFSVEFWKGGGALVLLMTAARSALKTVWKRTAPVTFGGVKK